MSIQQTRLSRVRRAAGYTQGSLAKTLAVQTGTVQRWEAGTVAPLPQTRRPLARALNISRNELSDVLAETRRNATMSNHHQSALAADAATVESLRYQVHALDERYTSTPSLALLTETGDVLGQLNLLAQHTTDQRRCDVLSLQTSTAILMGQLLWDASLRQDNGRADRYFQLASRAAREINDPAGEAHALLRRSYVAMFGHKSADAALDLLHETVRLAPRTALAGVAQLHTAEAHAMLGDPRSCEAALSAAETTLDNASATDATARVSAPGQIDRIAGSCYLRLGDHRRAQHILTAAVDKIAPPSKSRAIVLGNLSKAALHQHDLDGAVFYLHDALDAVEITGGGGGINVISQSLRTLRRWRPDTRVLEVYDRVLSLAAPA